MHDFDVLHVELSFLCLWPDMQCMELSSMVENAWTWAAQNGKLEKNPINGAEYAHLPVDKVRWRTNEQSRSLVLTATAQFEV